MKKSAPDSRIAISSLADPQLRRREYMTYRRSWKLPVPSMTWLIAGPNLSEAVRLASSEVHRSAVQSLLPLPSTLPSHGRDGLHFPIL
jgi:hypothetical protein